MNHEKESTTSRSDMDTSTLTFKQAFAPLAHFLFPDGCPDMPTSTRTRTSTGRAKEQEEDDDTEALSSHSPDLSSIWPSRSNRRAVSSRAALASIANLRKVARTGTKSAAAAHQKGLKPAQLWAVTLAACETLPKQRIPSNMHAHDDDSNWTDARMAVAVAGKSKTSLDVEIMGTTATNSKYFCDLVKCLLPRYKPTEHVQTNDDNDAEATYGIPLVLVLRLVSVAVGTNCDAQGRVMVLRFLTLAIRSGSLDATATAGHHKRTSAKQTFVDTCYATLLPLVAQPETCLDAVRLLHAMTRRRHVTTHRARRLREWWRQAGRTAGSATATADSNNSNSNNLSPIWLLLQLYARYDPDGCGKFLPSSSAANNSRNNAMGTGSSAWSKCFQIPDLKWEREFTQNARAAASPSRNDETVEPVFRPAKRPRLMELSTSSPSHVAASERQQQDSSSLTVALDWLHDAFDGVHSFSWGLVESHRQRRTVRASDLLMDMSLQQLILLSTYEKVPATGSSHGSVSNVADTEVARLRACLTFMLHEEWYDLGNASASQAVLAAPVFDKDDGDDDEANNEDNDDDDDDENNDEYIAQVDEQDSQLESLQTASKRVPNPSSSNGAHPVESSRLRLLRALASTAARANGLFPEAASFVLEEILPHWDGSDRMGLHLCHDLLPMLPPCSVPEFHSKVFRYLEPLFVYGSPRIQRAIVSGTLKGIIERWSQLDWSNVVMISAKVGEARNSRHQQDFEHSATDDGWKVRTLREIIKWSDDLFLKAFLANDGNDLLRVSVAGFFETVASVSVAGPFLAAPSPAVVYRLLLSQSALSVDRVCALLVKYKRVFQKLKEEQQQQPADSLGSNRVRSSDHIAIFNCFIWDFSCFLWRGSTLPSLSHGSAAAPRASTMTSSAGNGDEARANSICFTDLSRQALEHLHNRNDNEDASHSVKWALSITHGSVFAGFMADFLSKHQPHSTPHAIRGKSKVKYLEYLKNHGGLEGIYAFLTTFVSSLAAREQARQQKQK